MVTPEERETFGVSGNIDPITAPVPTTCGADDMPWPEKLILYCVALSTPDQSKYHPLTLPSLNIWFGMALLTHKPFAQ
jgi:hypothetical protein